MTKKQGLIIAVFAFPYLYLSVISLFKPVFLFEGLDAFMAFTALVFFVFYMLYTLKKEKKDTTGPLFEWVYTVVTLTIPALFGVLMFRVSLFHSYRLPTFDDYDHLDAYFHAVGEFNVMREHLSKGSATLLFYIFALLILLFALWLHVIEKSKRSA